MDRSDNGGSRCGDSDDDLARAGNFVALLSFNDVTWMATSAQSLHLLFSNLTLGSVLVTSKGLVSER